ncbi:MAG: hypothetical protein OJF49_002189 [Ktedonobacterales bacterium]|nr:MAG: hypothetical protein OJF49_002189 [Ktedonobacterales bacterium]
MAIWAAKSRPHNSTLMAPVARAKERAGHQRDLPDRQHASS